MNINRLASNRLRPDIEPPFRRSKLFVKLHIDLVSVTQIYAGARFAHLLHLVTF